MKRTYLTIVSLALATATNPARAQVSSETLKSLSVPDRIETSLGTLEFKDGAPNAATAQKLYDNLDFLHAQNVFLNTFQGASTYAMGEGLHSIGVEDNSFVIFPNLMDSKSLFLTANADTIYYITIVDLKKGPMVVEVPPMSLGSFDDMWFRWIIDAGVPGPDRGEGGKYLIVPPGYKGDLPDSGFNVGHSKTVRCLYFGRSFMANNNNPKPTVETIKKTLKIYPYTPGGYGTSIATALEGTVRLELNPPVPPTKFVDASGKSFNTIPPTDYSFYEMLNKLVQEEPADALDPELTGQMSAIGIVKGKPFAPDARMKKILTDAVNVANATARTLNMNSRESEGFAYYPGSGWFNWLFVGGYNFETPPPMVTKEGIKPFPPTGARTLNSRTTMFIGTPESRPRCVCGCPAPDRNTWSPRWTPPRTTSTAARPTKSRCRGASPRRTSGRSSCTTTRPAPCCKRASPSRRWAA
jgi:hypothetical protein